MQIKAQCGVERRQRHFIGAQRALERVFLKRRDKRFFPDDNPRLRPARQFIAGKTHETRPGGERLLRHRLFWQPILTEIDKRTAAEIDNHRQRRRLRQFGGIYGFGKAFNLVIAGVHFHQQRGLFADRIEIIAQVCAVGRAHFHQLTARLAHHIRDTKRAANLYQLAARHNHLFACAQRRQHQQHGRRVVINDTGVFRAGKFTE